MKTILIPLFGERIASRLDYAKYFQLVKIVEDKVYTSEKNIILSNNNIERINLVLSIKPNIIICNGITEFSMNVFVENNIKVISSIYGTIEDVIVNFLLGSYDEKINL